MPFSDLRHEKPGRRSLVFGAFFSLFFTLIMHWMFWAFTGDFVYALVPALILGGILFGFWAFMAHRAKVDFQQGHPQ